MTARDSQGGHPPRWGRFDEKLLSELRARAELGEEPAPAESAPATEPASPLRPHWIAAAGAVVGLVVALVLALVLIDDSDSPADPGSLVDVSALSAGPTAASESFSDRVETGPLAEHFGVDVVGLRQLGPGASPVLFAAPAVGDSLCVFYAAAGSAATNCGARELLARQPIAVEVVELDGSLTVAGVVPDGYESAAAGDAHAPVVGNGFVVRDVGGPTVLRVEGGGHTPLTLPVGNPDEVG